MLDSNHDEKIAQYPLSIYQRYFRRFFTFVVPLGCVAYFPVVALMGAADPLGSTRWLQCSEIAEPRY